MRVAIALLIAIGLPCSATAQVAGEIRGRITSAATARPVADSRIEVNGRTEIVRSGPDGSYVLRGLEPRVHTVTVRAVGHNTATREVETSNGRVTVLDIAMTPAASVLRDIVVSAVRDTSALNTAVFDRSTIEQSGRRDLSELLQTAPGIVVTQAGGPGQPSRISIRGSSSNQVLVLVDGVPLNSAVSGSADLSRVALETVDRVTVRTGAQSARYGPRAMAGVIEIETRKPRHELSGLLRTGAFGENNASMSVGNALPIGRTSAGGSLTADYRTVEGNFAYNLPAVRGGGRATRVNSDATSTQVLGALSLDGGFGSGAIRGTWQETRRGLAGTVVQPSLTGRQGNARWSSGAHLQGVVNGLAWTAAADFTRETGSFTDSSPPFGQAFDDSITAQGVTASSSAAMTRGALNVSAGGELRTLDVKSSMLAENAPHFQRLLGGWGNLRYSTGLLSPAFQLDGEVSARVDHNSLSGDAAFSPRAALRLSRGLVSTSVSLGSGYAPPTLADQFFHEGVQVRANPGLRPERTLRDLEGRVTVREVQLAALLLSGEAAAYRSNIEGMILWMPDFRFVWSPSNYNVNRSGFELSGTTRLPSANIEMQGTLNRTDVLYAGGILSGQVAYRPRNSANITLAFAPDFARFEVSNRYVGVRRTIAGSGLNALDPYWMTDAHLSSVLVRHGWTFNAAIGVENVMNNPAAMLVDYPFPGRTWAVSLRVRRSTSHSS